MGDPKWEELPFDCLLDIFGRVGWVSLVEGVPFVCKSWYQVTLSPLCWQSLIIADNDFSGPFPLESSFVSFHGIFEDDWPTCWMDSCEAFIKFVIRRSRGSASVLALPYNFDMSQEALRCIGEGCPSLKRLALGCEPLYDGEDHNFSSMICKWRNLEALEIKGSEYSLYGIIAEISVHCKNFVSLSAIDVNFNEGEAYAITTLLPNIKFLSLRESGINRSNVVILLKGCKNLVHLHLDVGIYFDVDDEIMNLAAHIPTSKFEVEELEPSDGGDYYDDYHVSNYNDFNYFD